MRRHSEPPGSLWWGTIGSLLGASRALPPASSLLHLPCPMSPRTPDPRPQTHSSAFTSVASGLGPPKGAREKEGGGRGGRREERRTRPGAPAQRVGQAAAGRPSGQSALRPQLTTKKGTTTCSTVGPPPKWARRAICVADGVAPASTINHQSTRRTMATCSRQPPGQLGCVGRPPTCRLPRPRISQRTEHSVA